MPPTIRGTGSRLSVQDKIAGAALARLRHSLVIPKLSGRAYEREFLDKNGDTITIKRPYDVLIGEGRDMAASAIQGLIDRTVEMKVDKRRHMALGYYDDEATLDIIAFGERYLKTGVERMAYRYDSDGGESIGTRAFYAEAHTAGLTTEAAHSIGAHARHVAIPLDMENYGLLDAMDFAAISNDIKMINVPDDVKGAIRQRYRGMLANWHLFETHHIPFLVCASHGGTPLISGANQEGKSLATKGWGASRKVLNKGQLFTITGVYEIYPRTTPIKSTGRLMTFAAAADVNSAADGTATIPLTSDLNAGTLMTTDGQGTTLSLAAFQNVTATPAADAAITILGAAGQSFRQGVFYHKSALEYANVQIEQSEAFNLKGRGTDDETGLSVSMVAWANGLTMQEVRRLDTLYGVETIYPEVAIRFVGQRVMGGGGA